MKQTGLFVVSLRGVNFGFWSRLGCSGHSTNILNRQETQNYAKRNRSQIFFLTCFAFGSHRLFNFDSVRWKSRSAGCGKCGVRKIRGVENAECGKCVENFNFPFQFQFSISNAEKQCVNNKKKKKKKKTR